MSDHLHLHIGNKASDDEKHNMDVNVVLYHKGKIYTGGDDGKIKVWNTDVKKVAEVTAHPCSVFSLAGSDDYLYSCSNEGTIKTFDLNTLKEISTVVKDEKTEYWKLFYADGFLYSGDNLGNIVVWKHGKELGETNILEPIKDLAVSGKFLFTVKDSDMVVTELHLDNVRLDEEHKRQIQFGTRAVHMGRYPVALIGKKYAACADRDGKEIVIIENNEKTNFKQFTKIEGAHEMLVNAIAGCDYKGQTLLFSGGWDKKLKKFRFDEDIVKLDCTSEVGFVVNSIAIGGSGEIYAAGGEGNLLRIEIEW
ncbi:uncharacterized protein LOC108917198 [Anoplophora glabripennis]|uniref:uncharacterized protein LOC108917198 n=1 Tax=Anoplophora glabripennis TaxID=217634 RepID=UPI0008737B96|nr:uncharacterized protein LOC108917198 [Anoplophora glabripennis]